MRWSDPFKPVLIFEAIRFLSDSLYMSNDDNAIVGTRSKDTNDMNEVLRS